MEKEALRLDKQKICITGVSRPSGIGATLARRFAAAGAQIAIHGYANYDLDMQYADAKPTATMDVANALSKDGNAVIPLTSSDLSKPGAAERVIEEALEKMGELDGLILNHAYSTCVPLGEWTAEHIDAHLLVNVRAAMLMIQAFAKQANSTKGGAITLFTSGQYQGPMTKEIAYAVSKEAIIGIGKQTAAALASRNIRVNCINPGPNDTGYASGEDYELVKNLFPAKRWGVPDDAADLVLFLHSAYGKWITGQVIASEGGFGMVESC